MARSYVGKTLTQNKTQGGREERSLELFIMFRYAH